MNHHEKEFVKKFSGIAYGQSRRNVFDDWVTMCSSALIVRANPHEAERAEAEYMALVSKYKREELDAFAEMMAIATMALTEKPQDFLGSVYMQCGMGNEHIGQFFTPYDLSFAIAEMTTHDIDPTKELITVSEPACGSGGMVVAFAASARKRGVDVASQLYVEARDLSEIVARMAMIQLSICEIPAHVIVGDTIAMTINRAWATHAYWPIAHKVAKWRAGEPEPEPVQTLTPPPLPNTLVQGELFTL